MPAQKKSDLKIALVHDYLREFGGAERVLVSLHELFPDAPVYTSFVDRAALGIHWQLFANWDIHQTWISKIPLHTYLYSPMRILAPKAFKDLDLSAFDIVISSSNAYMAKAVSVPNGKHFCYCHTPPRALYGYTTMTDWKKNPVIRVLGELINHYMRVVDFRLAQKVDQFIANSNETQRRIKKFYRRESVVIYPPVMISPKVPERKLGEYFLYVNRLALAKHPEIAVAACTKLSLPLKVVGSGPLLPQLKKIAGPTVEFLGSVSDLKLHQLYSGARALIYPVEDEDFGIVPVEAMGHGLPVLAHFSGGPKETIHDLRDQAGKGIHATTNRPPATGLFFKELSVDGLSAVLAQFDPEAFDRPAIHRYALRFSAQQFKQTIRQLILQ